MRMTDSQIETMETIFKNSRLGFDVDADCVLTQESLADFIAASSGWAEASHYTVGTVEGMPCIVFENKIQIRHGQSRRELSVIDFGDFRVAIEAKIKVTK